jgi:hypothetical protein
MDIVCLFTWPPRCSRRPALSLRVLAIGVMHGGIHDPGVGRRVSQYFGTSDELCGLKLLALPSVWQVVAVRPSSIQRC